MACREAIALAMAYQQQGQVHAQRGAPEMADESFERALDILDHPGLEERRALSLAEHRRLREARRKASKG